MKISTHHLSRYYKLISHYKNTISEGFVEKHHIKPKCLGGTDDAANLVVLPARAHFIAHALLSKAYPDNVALAHAFAMMGVNNSHQKRYISSKLYEMSKLARSRAMTGVARPEWVKQKMRKPKTNKQNYKKPKSKEHAINISLALKGKPKSKEHIKNSIIGRQKYLNEKKENHLDKVKKYQTLFLQSNMSRKQFAEFHSVKYSTMKKYLTGI